MSRIRGKNTKPELQVRALVRSLGFSGYRLHRKELPGKPDLAWVGRKVAVFVHGCFWHGHTCTEGLRVPKSRAEYWVPKLKRNWERDAKHLADLEAAGWHTLVVWDCDLTDSEGLEAKLRSFLQAHIR